ncbi:MAG: ferrous iron transport protein A [Firmicutes bacterium]|nr:ferrous iron transport protein A [Bacillota bacterium]
MKNLGHARKTTTLSRLLPGRCGIVKSLESEGPDRRRLLDLGLVPGTVVEAIRKSPAGDPVAYQIRGAVIALRREQGDKIFLLPL